ASQPQGPATVTSSPQSTEWLNDPTKLLQFIVASFVSRGSPGQENGSGSSASSDEFVLSDGTVVSDTSSVSDGSVLPTSNIAPEPNQSIDQELIQIVRLLSRVGRSGDAEGAKLPEAEMAELSGRTRELLEQALAGLAAQAPAGQSKELM